MALTVGIGDHAFCLSLLEKWMERGHTRSISLPKGRGKEATIASTLSNWQVECLGRSSSHPTFTERKARGDHGPSLGKGDPALIPLPERGRQGVAMAPAWERVTMPSALPFLRSGWSVAIVTPYHFQREEGKNIGGLYPSLIGRWSAWGHSHLTPLPEQGRPRVTMALLVGMGDHAFCLSLLEKWMECGHSDSISLPKGRGEEVTVASTLSNWEVEGL